MNKQIFIFIGVAAVLVALVLILENPFQGDRPQRPPEDAVELFAPIAEEECSRIVLSSGFGSTTTLVRKGREWFTRGRKADPDAVSRLFEQLEQTGTPELVSVNRTAFMKFRVDNFLGQHLQLFDATGNRKVDLLFGQLERNPFITPVRKPGSDKIYQVNGAWRGIFSRPDWRDFNILRLEADAIQRVEVKRPEESYVAERQSAEAPWFFTSPTTAPIDSTKADGWIQQISQLRASEFENVTTGDMLTTFGLTSPTTLVSVALADGSSYTVLFGNKVPPGRPTPSRPTPRPTGTEYYAKRLDDPQVYRIASYLYDTALKTSASLAPAPQPPMPPPGGVNIGPGPMTPGAMPPLQPKFGPLPITTGTVPAVAPKKPATPVTSPSMVLKPIKVGPSVLPPERRKPPSDKPTTAP